MPIHSYVLLGTTVHVFGHITPLLNFQIRKFGLQNIV